ncbi:hypothetical protein NL676_012692 [Syzygium grande]|nr:hypothetical protein NL676_012692 [Syzygium grande]
MPDMGEKVSGCTDRDFTRDHLVEISKFLRCEVMIFGDLWVWGQRWWKSHHRPSSKTITDRWYSVQRLKSHHSSLKTIAISAMIMRFLRSRINSRRKRRAVMNKIGVEITKAKRSNSINGGSLKWRVLTRGREVLMQGPSSYLSEVE